MLLVFSLGACSGVAVKEPGEEGRILYQDRAKAIASIQEWSFSGKISLDDGDEGGSGKLQWDVLTDRSVLDFHGAFGRGAWRLQIDPNHAVLKQASGETYSAANVNELVQSHIGWPLPVDALQWWVRGLAAPGPVDTEQFDSQGLLTHLGQFGWSIEINRYNSLTGLQLPVRLDARRDNYRVKLAIGRWRMGSGS